MIKEDAGCHLDTVYEFLTEVERLALLRYQLELEREAQRRAEEERLALEKSVQEIVDILHDTQGLVPVKGQSLSISGDRAHIK